MIRVLLADEQPLVRVALRSLITAQADIDIVGEASGRDEVVGLAAKLRPDVVLMDVALGPIGSGIEATEQILAARGSNSLEVLLLSSDASESLAFAALRAGAKGFLNKNADPASIIEAVHRVASGEAALEPRVTRRLIELFSSRLPSCADVRAGIDTARLTRHPKLADLTEREFEIFTAVARGMTNTELAHAFYLSESTIKSHIGHILMKLSLRDRVHMVMLGYQTGVVIPESRNPGPEPRPSRELTFA